MEVYKSIDGERGSAGIKSMLGSKERCEWRSEWGCGESERRGELRNETWGTEGGEQTCNCVLAIGLCPGSSVAYLLSL